MEEINIWEQIKYIGYRDNVEDYRELALDMVAPGYRQAQRDVKATMDLVSGKFLAELEAENG